MADLKAQNVNTNDEPKFNIIKWCTLSNSQSQYYLINETLIRGLASLEVLSCLRIILFVLC